MKAVILAAGYGTRLYPKTLNIPKAFLEYNDKKIIDYLIDDLKDCGIDEVIIVTNNKFYNDFTKYERNNVKIINDGSNCNEDRKGAVSDLILGINLIDDDVIVLASDSLLDFSFKLFIDFFHKINYSSIMYYKEYDLDKLKNTGQCVIESKRVIRFIEKPKDAISNNALPPFYIFKKNDLKYIRKCDKYDSLGKVIESLYKDTNIYAYKMPGKRIDIS